MEKRDGEIGIVRGYGVRNNIPVIMILKICNPDPDMYIMTAFMGILSSVYKSGKFREFRVDRRIRGRRTGERRTGRRRTGKLKSQRNGDRKEERDRVRMGGTFLPEQWLFPRPS
jgi:hypothetical protein